MIWIAAALGYFAIALCTALGLVYTDPRALNVDTHAAYYTFGLIWPIGWLCVGIVVGCTSVHDQVVEAGKRRIRRKDEAATQAALAEQVADDVIARRI